MRIGLIIYGSLDTISGGYLYDRQLVDHLRRQGDQVEIVSLAWRNYAAHLLDNFSAGLSARLLESRFDVLLQDELNHPSLAWLNRRLHGRYPIVSIVHHLRSSESRPRWQNRGYAWVERRYLRSVDGLVFNSRATRESVEALAGPLRPSVVAQPAADHLSAAIDEAAIAARARQPGPLRLAFVGNVIERKGLHVLLEALAGLGRPDWALTVIGGQEVEAGYAARIRAQIERAGLGAQVRLMGAVPGDELKAQLKDSQALVVPSAYEGFGIVYLEAMSFGLPVIATTAGAAGEIVTPALDGWLTPPGDARALADFIRIWLDDRVRLGAMGAAARRRFERQPVWAETAQTIRGFLKTMTAARR